MSHRPHYTHGHTSCVARLLCKKKSASDLLHGSRGQTIMGVEFRLDSGRQMPAFPNLEPQR